MMTASYRGAIGGIRRVAPGLLLLSLRAGKAVAQISKVISHQPGSAVLLPRRISSMICLGHPDAIDPSHCSERNGACILGRTAG
jgi:hypothetical protein